MDSILGYADAALFGEYLYYCSFYFNGFFRENIKTHNVEFLTFLPGDEKWGSELTGDVIYRNGSIIAFPVKAKGIFEFDIASGKTYHIYDPDLWGEGFARAIRIDEGFLLVPINIYDGFVVYKDDRTLCRAHDINNLFKNMFGNKDELLVDGFGACRHKDVIYIAISQSEWLIKFCLNSKRVEKFKIVDSSLRNLFLIGNDLWIVSDPVNGYKATAIRFDTGTGKYRRYEFPDIEDNHTCYGFSEYKDSLLAFEYEGNYIWIFDKADNAWRVFACASNYPIGFHRAREGYPLFFGFYHMDGKLMLLPTGGNGTITIDEATGDMDYFPSTIPDDFLEMRIQIEKGRRKNIIETCFSADGDGLLLESSDADIGDFISFF